MDVLRDPHGRVWEDDVRPSDPARGCAAAVENGNNNDGESDLGVAALPPSFTAVAAAATTGTAAALAGAAMEVGDGDAAAPRGGLDETAADAAGSSHPSTSSRDSAAAAAAAASACCADALEVPHPLRYTAKMGIKAFERVQGKPTGQDPGLWLHQVGGKKISL
jgi:hypothetical protein